MLDEALRPVKERLLAPVARALGARVSPMQVTLAAFALGMFAALAAARHHALLALGCWLGNRLLDGLDGTLARTQGRQTDLGAYVDIMLDFVVYAAVPLGLVLGAPAAVRGMLGFAAAVLLASFYVNAASWMYLSAILERRGAGASSRGELTSVTMPAGLVAGTETVVLYILFFLLPDHLPALFALGTVLVLFTALERLVWAVRRL